MPYSIKRFSHKNCAVAVAVWLPCLFVLCLSTIGVSANLQAAEPLAASPGAFLDEQTINWKVNEFQTSRWKTLVGGLEGGQISQEDIQFGLWELAPGAIYHRHLHEAPEIYYVTAGEALWTVGDETVRVKAGSTIYTAPHTEHRMENLTDEPVKAIWVWWAPDGRKAVFSGEYRFTEEAPAQKAGSGFGDNAGETLYSD